jgi:formylmethanofuran--tetrahydromethanopterin N-formyltransferase
MRKASERALAAIHDIPGVVTPFDVCSAGSKPETKYPLIGPTTNHLYCPSLKKKLGDVSRVPDGVNYIPEIVINGISFEAVKQAMKAGIEAAAAVDGVIKISAGNYGGKLGEYRINLRELIA